MLMILQWLETYDLNGESNGSASCRFYSTPGMGLNGSILRAKKRRFNSCSTNYKNRYQSITQGKVMKKAED
jgi:hypothetical protein